MNKKTSSPVRKRSAWIDSAVIVAIIGLLGVVSVPIINNYFDYIKFQRAISLTQTAEAPSTSASESLGATPPQTESPTVSPSTLPASPLPQPRIYDFATCLDPCKGSTALTTFPSKTPIIYLTWKYENIPQNALYVRNYEQESGNSWISWVTYDCTWTNPPSGSYEARIYDYYGLASGNWRITISVNGVVLLQKSIFIQGHWKNWDPQGVIHSCA